MVDTTNLSFGLKLVTGRARSAAKALSIVAGVLSKADQASGEDAETASNRFGADQIEAFNYLVDNVLSLTTEAAEIAEVLARGAKVEPAAAAASGTRRRSSEAEDIASVLKRDTAST